MVMLQGAISEDMSTARVVILYLLFVMHFPLCILFVITCSMFCMTWPVHLREINMYLLMSKNYDQETTCKNSFS